MKRESLPREYYMNFGGFFPDPDEEPELFASLPAWRRVEFLATRNLFRTVPGVQAFAILDPSTGKPYPGQILAEDYVRYDNIEKQKPAELPNSIKFDIPNGIPLAFFQRESVYYIGEKKMNKISGKDLTFEQAHLIVSKLESSVTLEKMIAECTPRGNGRGIKSNKPTDGIMAFIWRMARFYNGVDPTMPITCYWDLEDGISRLTGLSISTCIVTENVKIVLNCLDSKVNALILATGGNPNAAALRLI